MGTRRGVLFALSLVVVVGCADPAPKADATSGEATMEAGSSGSRGATSTGSAAGAGSGGKSMAGAGAGSAAGRPASMSSAEPPRSAAGAGAPAGGDGGAAASGRGGTPAAAGAGGAVAAEGCSRMLLQSSIDAFFVALAAHDPTMLPLSDSVKATENGEPIELGKAGLWSTAGALQHAHSALDTDECTAIAQAVVPDGSTPIPVALRLKLEAQKISEVELIAVRDGDFMLASNTDALIASAESVKWEAMVPADQRNTREELIGWMDKYFRMFPRGVCDTSSDCKRIENGGGSFTCSAGASCASSAPSSSDNALKPRLILADVETGVGIGFTMFQTNTDMHIFKMSGGTVHGVSAILAEASGSGWD